MPRRKPALEDSLPGLLYDYFLQFIDEKKAIPLEHAFYQWLILRKKFTSDRLPIWRFRYQFGKLIDAGWIVVDDDTRSLSPQRKVTIEVNRNPKT